MENNYSQATRQTYHRYSDRTCLLTTWATASDGSEFVLEIYEIQDDNSAPSFKEDDK